ncbi:MAG: acyl carrier protein [Candidatus Zixiibacteriota bacterium]|nr:MAG: acyl carrier protein [candidate division Zixibacteria bacterium]
MLGKESDDFTDNASLLDIGIIDSTGILELVEFVEEKYEISIEDHELVPENLDSVINLVNFIKKKST